MKTHKSEYFYEFAKRLIYKSHEIRPFPISAIKERKKKYYLLLNLLREESKKGWVFEEPVSIAVGVFYTQVIKFRSKRVKPIILKCEVLDRITQVIRGSLPADDVVNYVVRKFGLQMPCFTTAESEKILRMFALALFEKSLIPNPKSRRPLLGTLSTQLVIDLTSEEEFYSLLSYPGLGVEIIPILLVQGLVEEKYLLAKRGLIEYSVSGKDDWQLDLRSITFPLTDDVFVIRGRDLIIHAASRLSRTLVSHLQSIRLEDVLDHHDEVIYL